MKFVESYGPEIMSACLNIGDIFMDHSPHSDRPSGLYMVLETEYQLDLGTSHPIKAVSLLEDSDDENSIMFFRQDVTVQKGNLTKEGNAHTAAITAYYS